MGLTELIFKSSPAKIGVLTLDASVRELHSATAKATRHPIEADNGLGQNISDHIHVDPLRVDIEGVITNTPAEFITVVQTLTASGTKDLAFEAHQELLNNLLTGQLVTIVTTLLEYPNMVLEKVEVTRDASKGNALYFSASAAFITRVTLETTGEGTDTASTEGGTKTGGKTSTKDANAATSTKTDAISKFLRSKGLL